jgi:hypothetical protein
MANKPVLKAKDFASNRLTKTYLNWSIYELSTAFEHILFNIRNRFNELRAIPASRFTDFARWLGDAGIRYRMTRLAGSNTTIAIKPAFMAKHFPGISGRVIETMANLLSSKISEMEAECNLCKAHCLKRPNEFCPFFDQQPDTNPLVSTPIKVL